MCNLQKHFIMMCNIIYYIYDVQLPALYICILQWYAVYQHLVLYLLPLFAPLHIKSVGHLLLVCIMQHHIATFCFSVCVSMSACVQFTVFSILLVLCARYVFLCISV